MKRLGRVLLVLAVLVATPLGVALAVAHEELDALDLDLPVR